MLEQKSTREIQDIVRDWKETVLGPFHTRSSFGLSIHANANVRANSLREQFASFALSNAIRANNLRMKPIFDWYFTYWFWQVGSCI